MFPHPSLTHLSSTISLKVMPLDHWTIPSVNDQYLFSLNILQSRQKSRCIYALKSVTLSLQYWASDLLNSLSFWTTNCLAINFIQTSSAFSSSSANWENHYWPFHLFLCRFSSCFNRIHTTLVLPLNWLVQFRYFLTECLCLVSSGGDVEANENYSYKRVPFL